MQTLLITGANRGLGLEFCRQYSEQGDRVIACCRNPDRAMELQNLAQQYSSVSIHALDVADFGQVDELANALRDETIDVLLCNAGIYGDKSEHGFGALNYQNWEQTLRINTLAPVKLAEAFLPSLLKSSQPTLVAVTSLMGSIADNTSGGSLCYRSSKAALNAALKSLAIDLKAKNVAVLMLHPGWVKTDMGGINAPTNAEESISGMRRVIADFSLSDSGSFLNYHGEVLPW
jgi:NAD(P)-dependent dehydrogenase (short-subunit alcohol dehydrogenase family)